MLDSSGVFKPGFLYGNNYLLGSHSQCLDTMNTVPPHISQLLNNTLYHVSQKELPPFQINYFIAHFRHNSSLQYHITALVKVNLKLLTSKSLCDKEENQNLKDYVQYSNIESFLGCDYTRALFTSIMQYE